MKRLILALGIIATGFTSLYAKEDAAGDTYIIPNVYNASGTATGDQMVTIATAAFVDVGVVVTNPGNVGAVVGLFDGSFNQIGTTISATSANPKPYFVEVQVSSGGLKYNNINPLAGGTTAQITILWKYKYSAGQGLRTK